MKDNLLVLSTEERNINSINLPKMSIEESTLMMNKEDENCTPAVKNALPAVNIVIEKCVETIKNKGRVIFIGAAHSGYLGMLDAYEANATFGCTDEFTSIVAGNFTDIMKTQGSAEDSFENGGIDLESRNVTYKDFVIAISSSGRTPYAIGALKWCKENNVKCASLANNYNAIVSEYSDYPIEVVPGAEVVTGSTRLKGGTCQKMILNMITTITMAQLGALYENLMINVPPVSDKMRQRLAYIITQATGSTLEHAKKLLLETNYDIKLALLMEIKKINKDEAKAELEKAEGNINNII